MEILIISGTPGTSEGSVEKFYESLTKKLITKGQQVTFIFTSEGPTAAKIKQLGANINIIEMKKKIDMKAIIKILKLLRVIHPHIIHIHFDKAVYNSLLALLFYGATLRDISIFVHHHSKPLKIGSHYKNFIKFLPRRLLYKLIKVTSVFVSEEQAKILIKNHLIYNNQPIKIINNGVDINVFSPINSQKEKMELRRKLLLPLDCIITIYVAGFRKEKNHKYLISAFNIAKNNCDRKILPILLLVGYGPEEDNILKLISTYNLESNVIITGKRNDVNLFLKSSDIAVSTSLTEGFPLGILEAMATGLPIISLESGFTQNLVEDNLNGFVVKKDSEPDIFAKKLIYLWENKDLRIKMGSISREKSKKYSLDNQISEVLKLYGLFS
ncbi:MAG: hypothetical protein PWQ68_1619 [Thermoanaerobacteraceae bacterium]|nr:hypothetical protein [Thermoanaerobacteraceae bacterium]